MMRVLVCGDRNWTDAEMIYRELAKLTNEYPPEEVLVIEGEAKGADLAAAKATERLDYRIMRFPADWEKHHRAAGPIRNRQMLVEGKPDVVWAFHDDLEHSKGTKNMVDIATKAGVPVVKFKHVEQGALALKDPPTGQQPLDILDRFAAADGLTREEEAKVLTDKVMEVLETVDI